MNQMAEAFKAVARAKARLTGGGDVVILAGRHIKDAVVEEITYDETMIAGGVGEEGGYRVHIPITPVGQRPPRGQDVVVNGNELEVLSVVERNKATYELVCGQMAVE